MAIIGIGNKGKVNGSDVNVRTDAGTSYSRVYYAQLNDIVVVQDGKNGTDGIWWLKIKNETRNTSSVGWIRNDFVDPYTSGGTPGGGTLLGTGKVIGGGPLYCRKQPVAGYEYWGQFAEGTTVQIYSCTTSGWYETRWPANGTSVGYVMSQYIQMGGSTGTATYTFSASNAVSYALNHSDNTSGACGMRNTSFPTIDGVDDCADFVHQCLCAGGVPMFNGWFYSRIIGTPAGWSDSKWGVTYSGYEKLNGKGWLETVNYNAVKSGDIIYSYDASASPTPFTHVTIAVSGNVYDGSKYGVMVCGNTVNQNNKFKELTTSNCRCYRVKTSLSGDGTEKRVSLPLTGSGATVL